MSRGSPPALAIDTRRTSASSSGETTTSRVVVKRAVAAHELRAILGEHDVVAVGPRAAWLVGRRPHLAAVDVAQEDVAAPIVARRVLAPARDGMFAPAAVARARGGQHHGVAAVGQQVRGRAGGVRIVQAAHDGWARGRPPWR